MPQRDRRCDHQDQPGPLGALHRDRPAGQGQDLLLPFLRAGRRRSTRGRTNRSRAPAAGNPSRHRRWQHRYRRRCLRPSLNATAHTAAARHYRRPADHARSRTATGAHRRTLHLELFAITATVQLRGIPIAVAGRQPDPCGEEAALQFVTEILNGHVPRRPVTQNPSRSPPQTARSRTLTRRRATQSALSAIRGRLPPHDLPPTNPASTTNTINRDSNHDS